MTNAEDNKKVKKGGPPQHQKNGTDNNKKGKGKEKANDNDNKKQLVVIFVTLKTILQRIAHT
jgi:hypothetical protein